MPIRETTQFAQPVPESSPIPTKIPLLPADVVKRFGSAEEFNFRLDRFWKTTRELIIRDHNDVALAANTATAKQNLLFAQQDDMLAEIRRIDKAWMDGDAAIAQTIATIVASSGGARTYVQTNAPAGAATGDLWFDLDEGFKEYRWNGVAWVEVGDTRIAGNTAALTNEATVRATADSAQVSSITGLIARLDTGDIATAISALNTAVGPSGSLATSITSISARLNSGDIATAITTIQTTYATKTYAQSMRDDAISAAVTSADSYTNGQISSLSSVYATQTSVTTQISTAQTAAVTTANSYTTGQISGLSSVYITPSAVDTKIATAISGAITTTETYADSQISNLSSVYITPAAVDTKVAAGVSGAITTADSHTTSAISALSSVYITPSAVDTKISTAISASVSTERSITNSAISNLSSVYITPTSVDSKISSAITASLGSSSAGTIGGAISSLSSVYLNQTQVNTSVSNALSASIGSTAGGTIGALVLSESQARATSDGYLSGKYTVRVDANGSVAGMNISSVSDSGANTSEISFLSSAFKIYTSSGSVAPFQVSGNTVRITGSLVITSSDVTGLGLLATKGSVDLNSTDVINKSLAVLDNAASTKLSGIAANATAGATWGSNLGGIPAFLGSPTGAAGLYIGASYLGYHNGSAWKTYMDNGGGFYLGGSSSNSLSWDGSTLSVSGTVNCGDGMLTAGNARFNYNGGSSNGGTSLYLGWAGSGNRGSQIYSKYNNGVSDFTVINMDNTGGISLEAVNGALALFNTEHVQTLGTRAQVRLMAYDPIGTFNGDGWVGLMAPSIRLGGVTHIGAGGSPLRISRGAGDNDDSYIQHLGTGTLNIIGSGAPIAYFNTNTNTVLFDADVYCHRLRDGNGSNGYNGAFFTPMQSQNGDRIRIGWNGTNIVIDINEGGYQAYL